MMIPTNSTAINSTERDILLFNLEGQNFCVDLNIVEKIIYFTKTQYVPNMPSYFVGLLNLYGDNIPVIDLALKLELKCNTPFTIKTPIVICKDNTSKIALIVDEIYKIELSNQSKLQMSELFKDDTTLILQGNLCTSLGDALLLNIQNLFEKRFKKNVSQITQKNLHDNLGLTVNKGSV